jgi:hypothetical protein
VNGKKIRLALVDMHFQSESLAGQAVDPLSSLARIAREDESPLAGVGWFV